MLGSYVAKQDNMASEPDMMVQSLPAGSDRVVLLDRLATRVTGMCRYVAAHGYFSVFLGYLYLLWVPVWIMVGAKLW